MTRFQLALLGDPVRHSRSPEIHRAMLGLAGLEGDYQAIVADEAALDEAVDELRAGRWDGLNVTMPLKAHATSRSDRLSLAAERAQSVNTLFLRSGEVHGDSTDSSTFRHLLDSGRFGSGAPILVLGSGGSAAAALAALSALPAGRVYLSARHVEQAETITARLGGQAIPWCVPVAGALVVNTTPLGMEGEPLPDGLLEMGAGLIDLPYGPIETPAVRQATESGMPVADGHEFLLRQAIASFQLWTGVALDFGDVEASLRKV